MPSYLARWIRPVTQAGFAIGVRTDNIPLIPLNQFSNTITIAGNAVRTTSVLPLFAG